MSRRTFSVIGAGRVGCSLGHLLVRSGWAAGAISCRTLRSARRAVRVIGDGTPAVSNARAATRVSLVLITTPDAVVPAVARELASTPGRWDRMFVAHTSGALSSTALAPLARRGARTASLHPLASIADPASGPRTLIGAPFAIEGHAAAVRSLRKLIVAFGGVPVKIPRRAKVLYHLLACLLSNDLVALLSIGFEAARRLGLGPKEAARLYLPLVRGTVDNVTRHGAVKALTGPISRGDLRTLELHAVELRHSPAELTSVHRILALRSVTLARAAGSIDAKTAVQLTRQLRSIP